MDLELINHLPEIGLITFIESDGMGLEICSLEVAQLLAQQEKTIYVSYHNTIERINDILKLKNDNLSVDVSLGFLHPYLHLEISMLLKRSNYRNLIIFNTHGLVAGVCNSIERNWFVENLEKISREESVRIILCTNPSRNLFNKEGDNKPKLEDVTWSRSLVHLSVEIYTLYRPSYFGITEIEEIEYEKFDVEISSLLAERRFSKKYNLK